MVPLIPLGHFFDNPERAMARISPDGRQLSYLAPEEGRLNVWVRTIGRDDDRAVTHDHERGVTMYLWSRDSGRILYLRDRGGDENYHLFAVDLSAPDAPARDLTPFAGVKVALVDVPRQDPDHVLVATNRRERSAFDVERLDLRTGALEPVAENPGNISSWVADRDGRLRAAFAQTPTGDHELLTRGSEDEPFRVIAGFDNEDDGHPFAFSADGDALYVASAVDCDLRRLVAIDVLTGAATVLDEDEEADLGGAVLSERTGELLGAVYRRDRIVLHAFDERFGRDWERLRQVHAGDPAITGEDDAEERWVVSFDDDRDPGATYLFDRRTGEAEFLFRPRPWLRPEELAPMQAVRLGSRDRLVLRSYLTLPVGLEPRGLPMVLYVHGGPWARDRWGYDGQAQFLANRGYAVLQVNYRGSTGFGKRFAHAAEHEFAGRMHDDLVDAVRWATDQGIADPARIGIYGGSYGGYAALVGATFTPELFAAVASVVGPSNLVTLIRSFPAYWRPLLQGSWYRYVGDPEDPDQRADLEARSPLFRADRIRAPLLVIQGANDPRVTKQESDQIVEAARANGVEVEYLVMDDEGHGFTKPESRMEAYRALEVFLARHLGGRSEAPAEA